MFIFIQSYQLHHRSSNLSNLRIKEKYGGKNIRTESEIIEINDINGDELFAMLQKHLQDTEKNDIPNLDVLFQNLNTYIDGSIPEAADRLKESLQLQQDGSWQQWTNRFKRLIHDLQNCYVVISKGDGSPEKTRTRINRARISMRNLRLSQ